MTGQQCSHGWALEGIYAHPLGSQAQPIRISFSTQKGFITDRNAIQHHPLPHQTITQVVWRTWVGVVTHGLRLWGRLDILPNSLKWHLRQLMVDKLAFNSLATALVDIPAVSMPIAHTLKTWDICGIVLCDKTAHFKVAFYCPSTRWCNDHAV